MKGGIRTNNIEVNARLCMASVVAGFLTTYGSDEPAGCYDDLDLADTFVLSGANMADNHPMLFNRVLRRRQDNPNARIISITTLRTPTDLVADETFLIQPHSDLMLGNALAYTLQEEELADDGLIGGHVAFKQRINDVDTTGRKSDGVTVGVPSHPRGVGRGRRKVFSMKAGRPLPPCASRAARRSSSRRSSTIWSSTVVSGRCCGLSAGAVPRYWVERYARARKP